jgi:oligoribonuclease
MIWVDLETFGLNPQSDPVVEVGFKITDLDLVTIDDFQIVIWDTPTYDERFEIMKNTLADQYVYKMHQTSGLWEDCQRIGASPDVATEKINTFLEGHGIRGGEEPLCGSSVHFDRDMLGAQFPSVFERFHYRIIDNSVLKGLCQAFSPELYVQMDLEPEGLHRVLPDLDDTVNEFRFYKDNFIFETRKSGV